MSKLTTNFFWVGDDFQFLNRLTILSHLIVGHNVTVWLSGDRPNSLYWIDDIESISIKSADKKVNIQEFLDSGGNTRTASSLFRFDFLYRFGGLYCDTDMIAIKKFPNAKWILAAYSDEYIEGYNLIATGIIKAPKGYEIFKDCRKNIRKTWGNVTLFTKKCGEYNLKNTHPNSQFYPWGCKSGYRLLTNIGIPSSFGLHFYFKSTSKLNISHKTIDKYPNSLLAKLQKRIFKDYSLTNKIKTIK